MSKLSVTCSTAFLAGLMGFAGMVDAREIYVALDGNDSGSGSLDQPLQSIQKALNQAGPGDVVRIRGGVYRIKPLVLNRSGSRESPLAIEGMPGEEVILKGSQLVTGWQQSGEGVWMLPDWQINSQQLFVDGKPLQQIGIQTRWHTEKLWADHVCLPPVGKGLEDLKEDSFFYDKEAKVLYCRLAGDAAPNGRMMEASVEPELLVGLRASNIVLRNLTFMHSNQTATSQRRGMVQVGPENWLIENCRFMYSDFGGLSVSGNNHIVRNSQFISNGCVGIDVNGSDEAHGYRWYPDRPPMNLLLENIELVGNNYRQFFDQWHAGAMKLVPACRGVTIRRCRIVDNKGAGIWFDGGLGGNVIEDNLLVNNMTGIFYEIAQPALPTADHPADEFGALIRNNRVINGSRQGIYISASCNAIVENNTCYRNVNDIVIHGMPRKAFGGNRRLENNIVRNNIVSTRAIGIVLFVGEGSANNVVEGNFYALLAGEQPKGNSAPLSITTAGYGAGVFRDLKEAYEKTGYERTGKMGDPLWVDVEKLDFRLKEGSAAAGKGWQPRNDSL